MRHNGSCGYLLNSAVVIPPGQYVMLAVQDTGIGMTDEVRLRIFEPFFTTKEASHGTGLGLATVYGIVNQSNGYIWVSSEPGAGTTLQVFFPPHRNGGAGPSTPTTGEFRVPSATARILIVEDEPVVRAVLARALSHEGYTVIEARHGAEAIAILGGPEPIDLMITDMVMPGMSGAALVAAMRPNHPDLPVLILSGYSDETASPTWRIPEHAAFLEKPVSPSELVRRVRQLLEQG